MSNETVAGMGDLHGLLARELTDQLKNGIKVINKETGEIETVSATPATMNVIRQFLRDNNIECLGTNNEDIKDLVDELPYETEESARPN